MWAVNWLILRLVTVMNFSSAAEGTPGLPFLGRSLMRDTFFIGFDVFFRLEIHSKLLKCSSLTDLHVFKYY